MNIGQELLNAPFPQMIKQLGMGIAEAQFELDKLSVRIAKLMAGFKEGSNGELIKDDSSLIKLQENGESYSLLALGFTPTFYQFIDTTIEIKMAISMKTEKSFGASLGVSIPISVVAASVNASYSQKYQYSASGSSSMSTKLITYPAPLVFEQKLKELTVLPQQINA